MDSFHGTIKENSYYGRKYQVAEYIFTIRRNGKTSVNVMFIPGMMISIQSFNTFFIKIEAPLRIQFATATLLTLIMFLIMITKFIPITSEDPLMELLFLRLVSSVFMIEVFIILQQYYSRIYKKIKAKYITECDDYKIATLKRLYQKLKKEYKQKKGEFMSQPEEDKKTL